MTVERIHYSPTPIAAVVQRKHYGKTRRDQFKPFGFWYSIGDAWDEWCKTEMPKIRGTVRYAVDVSKANLLVLSEPAQVVEFNATFGEELYPGSSIQKIDWGRVAQQWDGIEVNPYHWDLRLQTDMMIWYYGWDVPSGCVWDVAKLSIRAL